LETILKLYSLSVYYSFKDVYSYAPSTLFGVTPVIEHPLLTLLRRGFSGFSNPDDPATLDIASGRRGGASLALDD